VDGWKVETLVSQTGGFIDHQWNKTAGFVVALTNRMTSGADVCARTVLTKSFFASQSACEAMKR